MDHEFELWVGIDWGTEAHRVVGVDGRGAKLFEWSVRHAGDDIAAFVERLLSRVGGHAERIAVSIDRLGGAAGDGAIA